MAHVRDLLLSDSDTERQFDDVFGQYFDVEARAVSSDEESISDTESDSGDDGVMDGTVAEAADPRAAMPAVAQPAEAAAAAAAVATNALPLRRAANCRCPPGSCIESFDVKSINMMRVLNASLDKSQLDLLILGKVSTVIMRDTTTVSSRRKAQTARSRTRCAYTHEGN